MTEEVIEAKETLHAQKTPVRVTSSVPIRATSVVIPAGPQAGKRAGGYTRKNFEGAWDRVSRPTGRGKLSHLRPSSEEFAKRKQEEIDLEERPQ
jgi:hypothetical protein